MNKFITLVQNSELLWKYIDKGNLISVRIGNTGIYVATINIQEYGKKKVAKFNSVDIRINSDPLVLKTHKLFDVNSTSSVENKICKYIIKLLNNSVCYGIWTVYCALL